MLLTIVLLFKRAKLVPSQLARLAIVQSRTTSSLSNSGMVCLLGITLLALRKEWIGVV